MVRTFPHCTDERICQTWSLEQNQTSQVKSKKPSEQIGVATTQADLNTEQIGLVLLLSASCKMECAGPIYNTMGSVLTTVNLSEFGSRSPHSDNCQSRIECLLAVIAYGYQQSLTSVPGREANKLAVMKHQAFHWKCSRR